MVFSFLRFIFIIYVIRITIEFPRICAFRSCTLFRKDIAHTGYTVYIHIYIQVHGSGVVERKKETGNSYKSSVATRHTRAYLLRLGERRKNTKLMQFCNYARARPIPPRHVRAAGTLEGTRRNARDTNAVALFYPTWPPPREQRENI